MEKISKYFTKIDYKYIKFLKYFNKIWKNNNLLNFNQFSEVKYKFRTNNYIESYHLLLSKVIENYYPKISFYLYKLKNIIRNYYNNYISNLKTFNNNEVYQYNINKDELNFIVNFHKKQKLINFNDKNKLQDNNLISIPIITYKILDVLFVVENYNESEDLCIKNYENLDDKDNISLLSNIKFIKNYLTNYNSSEKGINISDNHENDNISDNDLSEDNNT